MGTLQNITVAGLLADLGLVGYNGLSAAVHPSDHTTLDVAVTRPAWALLFDGTLLTTELISTSLKAPSTDGTYHLSLDAQDSTTATASLPRWTIATTGPSARALHVGSVVVSGGTISAVLLYPAGLRNFPVVGGAPLVWRGPFDAQGQYAQGHLVRAGSALYVCTDVPETVLDTRTDTFVRDDQDGWGTASDGTVWVADGGMIVADTITSHQGLALTDGSDNGNYWLLGDTFLSPDLEMLVRWQFTTSMGNTDAIQLVLNNTPSRSVTVTLDGTISISAATVDLSHTFSAAWAGAAQGQLIWTRVHRENGVVQVRVWLDPTDEPSSWNAEWAVDPIAPNKVGLLNAQSNANTTMAVDHFSVTMLAQALPWPTVDSAHWALMAG